MGADGTGVLIVDDLVDTGKTLELVRRLYPKAHFATVYAKPQGRTLVDTYITEVSQDTWISSPGTWRCNTCGRTGASSAPLVERTKPCPATARCDMLADVHVPGQVIRVTAIPFEAVRL